MNIFSLRQGQSLTKCVHFWYANSLNIQIISFGVRIKSFSHIKLKAIIAEKKKDTNDCTRDVHGSGNLHDN